MLVNSDLLSIIFIVADRKGMFANFFIYGEGNFGEEIGRNFRKGSEQVSQMSVVRKF
jgi:hypothetical protein